MSVPPLFAQCLIFAALFVVGWFIRPVIAHYRKRRREEREGWRLVNWRRTGYGYELHFHNGTIVREGYYYPSGVYVGPFDPLDEKIQVLEKQLEFGQHRELQIKEAADETQN